MTAAEFFTNQGHKEGRNEEKVAVAKNALRKGYESEIIADLTGLDATFIEQLKSDLEDE